MIKNYIYTQMYIQYTFYMVNGFYFIQQLPEALLAHSADLPAGRPRWPAMAMSPWLVLALLQNENEIIF